MIMEAILNLIAAIVEPVVLIWALRKIITSNYKYEDAIDETEDIPFP